MSPFTIDSKACYLLNNKCYLRIIYRLLPEEELEPVSVLIGMQKIKILTMVAIVITILTSVYGYSDAFAT